MNKKTLICKFYRNLHFLKMFLVILVTSHNENESYNIIKFLFKRNTLILHKSNPQPTTDSKNKVENIYYTKLHNLSEV